MMERLWSGGGCAGAARWAGGGEEEFWESKGLSMHDWPGLTGLVYTDIFSLDFLTPLDDQDTKFKLEVSPFVHFDITGLETCPFRGSVSSSYTPTSQD